MTGEVSMYGYKCPNCKALRAETVTTRSREKGTTMIRVNYDCGTYYELEKLGTIYRPKNFEYGCMKKK